MIIIYFAKRWRRLLKFLASLLVLLATVAFAQEKPEVVIDASLKADAPQSGLRPERVRRGGKVFSVFLINDSRKPGDALVKIVNLRTDSGTFDCYVDRQLLGSFSPEELAKGLTVPLRYGVVDLNDVDYLTRISKGCSEVVSSLRSYTEGDGKVVHDLCNQINGWAKLSLRMEEKSRATDIMLNPSGEPLPRLVKDDRASYELIVKAFAQYIERIAVVRQIINGKVKDPVFREMAASTLLPHDMEVKTCTVKDTDGGIVNKAIVTYTNRAEVPVSVKLSIIPADGVTVKATGKTDIASLARGKSITCGFLLKGTVSLNAVEKRSTAVARAAYKDIAFSARRVIPQME